MGRHHGRLDGHYFNIIKSFQYNNAPYIILVTWHALVAVCNVFFKLNVIFEFSTKSVGFYVKNDFLTFLLMRVLKLKQQMHQKGSKTEKNIGNRHQIKI